GCVRSGGEFLRPDEGRGVPARTALSRRAIPPSTPPRLGVRGDGRRSRGRARRACEHRTASAASARADAGVGSVPPRARPHRGRPAGSAGTPPAPGGESLAPRPGRNAEGRGARHPGHADCDVDRHYLRSRGRCLLRPGWWQRPLRRLSPPAPVARSPRCRPTRHRAATELRQRRQAPPEQRSRGCERGGRRGRSAGAPAASAGPPCGRVGRRRAPGRTLSGTARRMTMSETLSQAHIMALGHGFMDAKVLLTEGRTRRVFGRRPRRVCVIGAGISGLVTAKVLLEDGFDPLVFEKDGALGGVWSPSRTYPGLCANNTRDTYAFSDHPYPPTAGRFPSAEQVRDYLGSYADRFGLRPRLRFRSEVLRVARPAGAARGFVVTVRQDDEQPATHAFDFVAVCNG